MTMAVSDDELECLWEGEEEHMDEEDKDWLIERLRDKDIFINHTQSYGQ